MGAKPILCLPTCFGIRRNYANLCVRVCKYACAVTWEGRAGRTVYEQFAAQRAILKKQTEHCQEKRWTAFRPKTGANTAGKKGTARVSVKPKASMPYLLPAAALSEKSNNHQEGVGGVFSPGSLSTPLASNMTSREVVHRRDKSAPQLMIHSEKSRDPTIVMIIPVTSGVQRLPLQLPRANSQSARIAGIPVRGHHRMRDRTRRIVIRTLVGAFPPPPFLPFPLATAFPAMSVQCLECRY